jgi:aspartate aminotransferase
MPRRWAKRVNLLSESTAVTVSGRARELQQSGVKVVNLGGGKPDFNTPLHIGEAAVNAINPGFTHYVANKRIHHSSERPLRPNFGATIT